MNNTSSLKQLQIINAIWWSIISIIHSFALSAFDLTITQIFLDSFICNFLLASGCVLIFNNMRFYLPRQEKYYYVLVISLAVSGVWLFASNIFLKYIFKTDARYLEVLGNSLYIRFGVSFLMVSCMSMISLLWYTQQEQQETSKRKADAERLTKEAELFKLRQQLQPHFLFNSLNSISALTGSQPEKARHMIQQLSDFLRGTLRRDNQQWSSLKEELDYLQLYLDIEKVRFGYRLQTNIECTEQALQMRLPSLLLQPVVENAIKFGLYDTVGEVLIAIKSTDKNEQLEITVTNPFDEETAQPLQGTGFGLASIKRRLFLLFARHDLLQTSAIENKFITTIVIPQLYEGDHN